MLCIFSMISQGATWGSHQGQAGGRECVGKTQARAIIVISAGRNGQARVSKPGRMKIGSVE